MKESYFMLDGSMSHILPNDRPYMQFADFQFYEDEYINQFTDEVIQSRSSQEYKFSQLITGYECFDNGNGENYTNQWDKEGEQLVIYSQMSISDYNKLKMFSSTTPEYDFRYFKDVLKVREDTLSVLPMEQGKEYINVYTPPYRYIIENDRGSLEAEAYETETVNTLASLALIHDRSGHLDLLIQGRTDIDLNHLFLLSCLYVKTELLTRLEDGAYDFDVEQLLARDGTTLINYTAASGNVPFFESIYAKYYQRIINGLSDTSQKSFIELIWRWARTTSNSRMLGIALDIEKGRYNGR
jgi:hypothetical protein